MNDVLVLKGNFDSKPNSAGFGKMNLPKAALVTAQELEMLKKELEQILVFWNQKENDIIGGALVSVHYKHVVAKSNRIKSILSKGANTSNSSIRGAKFIWESDKNGKVVQKHVFTHFVSKEIIADSINKLGNAINVLNDYYNGFATKEVTEKINDNDYTFDSIMSKTSFLGIIIDCFYVEHFRIDKVTEEIVDESIVTIYRTGVDSKQLLSNLGIDMINVKTIDDTTLRLLPKEIKLIQRSAPFLISMSVSDFSKIEYDNPDDFSQPCEYKIDSPTNQPIIGVIDTLFWEDAYFSAWVENHDMVPEGIEISNLDKRHGTAVTSIIVDGPRFNPKLDDGCGNFRVRHFGVATHGVSSSFTILKSIREIVSSNTDIKVWNLSLGAPLEINPNFISPEAAELDKIQSEYDVVFVVAGTNKTYGDTTKKRIGAPADSLNSLVVNSVNVEDKPATYTRTGPVLSFFHKPDVSYYGGDYDEKINVIEPYNIAHVCGTSFAAPWISRKLAYLIHIMGLSREVAKALIIDSAAAWDRKDDTTYTVGFGVVPIRIEDIIHSNDDEIRFIMTGSIDEYETYTYKIPVPINSDSYPYFAKATLVYFPKSDRNQGVDYTSTEMDIHFGRLKEVNGKPRIQSINSNNQSDETEITLYEQDARKLYRKWDNVKHISERISPRSRPRSVYPSNTWGLSIKTKERLAPNAGKGLNFGVVVTLKEMYGVNRINEFIKLAQVRGWIVQSIDVENRVDIYQQAEEELEFE